MPTKPTTDSAPPIRTATVRERTGPTSPVYVSGYAPHD